MPRPYVQIPYFPEPGQARAFVDREEQIKRLFNAIVMAGNALVGGNKESRHRHIVHGYMGVGKSSIIIETLAMLRGEAARVSRPIEGLREPDEAHRWIVIRVSGKNAPSVDALAGALSTGVKQEAAPEASPAEKAVASLISDVTRAAGEAAPRARPPGIFHRLLPTSESRLHKNVMAVLRATIHGIDFARGWLGASRNRSLSTLTSAEKASQTEAKIQADLQTQFGVPSSAEAKAGMELAASYLSKNSASIVGSDDFKLRARVDAEMFVALLNNFFEATRGALLPTILVLDDLDEVTSSVGPSVESRSQVLSTILAPFHSLAPTCLIIGLRQEYLHEDLKRKFTCSPVPPMPRSAASELLGAWGEVQSPRLAGDELEQFKALGDVLFSKFEPDAQILLPFRLLPFAEWLNNSADPGDSSEASLIKAYLDQSFDIEVVEILERLARVMPADDIRLCAAARPVDPTPYAITERERHALERSGLLRPAMAGDPHDQRVVIDPMAAYLRVAIRA